MPWSSSASNPAVAEAQRPYALEGFGWVVSASIDEKAGHRYFLCEVCEIDQLDQIMTSQDCNAVCIFDSSLPRGGILEPEHLLGHVIGDQRIMNFDAASGHAQRLNHRSHRGVPQIIRIVLEGQAQDCDLGATGVLAEVG